MSTTHTPADTLPREIARVEKELIPLYESIGAPGQFAVIQMCQAVSDAKRAIVLGDTTAMLRASIQLKGFKE